MFAGLPCFWGASKVAGAADLIAGMARGVLRLCVIALGFDPVDGQANVMGVGLSFCAPATMCADAAGQPK